MPPGTSRAQKRSFPKRPSVLLALGWYAPAIHRGIARFAREANWSLDISVARSGHPPGSWEGSGIICILHMDEALDRFVESAGVPTVQIGNADHPRFPRVSADNQAVGTMAAEYFLRRGFRRHALFRRTDSIGEKERFRAYQEVIRKADCTEYLLDWVGHRRKLTGDNARVELRAWLIQELRSLPKPVAVFAEYDDLAIEILDICVAAGLRVPEEVAVLGVDDDPLRCDFAPVPLSSVDDDQELVGYEAARLLDLLLRGKPLPKQPLLVTPRGVTTRVSTDVLAIEHPHVVRALRNIWEHYTEQIGAKQVAAGVPMSYRRLHDVFVKYVGRSIPEEINWKRIEHAKRLLEETDKKTIEIARLSGFSDHDRMGKVFRRITGLTPNTYRSRFQKR